MSSSLIGKTLGNYKVIDRLGQGGMATVYVGYQEAVDRKVAIKVLPPHPGLNADFVERFRIEARTIANLQHPHILPLYDYGTEDDIIYLAMAYADGGSLDDRLKSGPLTIRETEKTLREVAGALDHAHRRGVIHRDIKPGNILLSSEGYALLADFGIAKLTESSASLTGTGVVGTPAYMAPEAAQGAPLDHRADVYSLGVLAYQMLTGQQPITAPSMMQLMLKVIQEPHTDILEIAPHLPAELKPVFDKVLAKSAKDRYQTATEFAEAFSEAVHTTNELKAVRAALPLDARTPEPPTTEVERVPASAPTEQVAPPTVDFNAATSTQPNTTTIIQQGVSPNVLIAVVGVVAVAVIGLIIVLTQLGGNGDAPPTVTDVPAVAVVDDPPTAVPAVTTTPTFGRVTYTSVNALGDTVSVRLDGVRRPPGRQGYVAWLVNTATDDVWRIGEVAVDGFGNGALTVTDPDGKLLAAKYNALYLSLETDMDAMTPSGEVAYSGTVPVALADTLYETFIESDDGINGGSLLDGMMLEARIATEHAGLASRSTTVGSMHLHAEHTVNILRGEAEDLNGNGRGENPGRGVGVYALADAIESRLQAAIEDAPPFVQAEAELIRVCLQNSRVRSDRVIELEFALLGSDNLEAVQAEAEESAILAAQINSGFDLNDNGIIEPFEGECGLEQIEIYGLLVATLDIVEGLPE